MTADTTPFPKAAFDKLAKAEGRNWWFRARNRVLLWVLKTRVGEVHEFLEVGCGTGFVLEGVRGAFPQAVLSGTEFFDEGLVHARQRVPSASFEQLDARLMDAVERFQVIGAFDVIEHITEDERVLQNLAQGLRPGGWLLLTVPQHRWLWSAVDEHACHVRRYTRGELLDKVNRAGLGVAYVTSFVSLLVPLMWLSRQRSRGPGDKPKSELQISDRLNRTLEWVMNLELRCLKWGLTFPVGGSLLVLARKP